MQDFFPEEMRIRRYIFDTWRRVCEQFGYEEYQTPLLEEAAVYRAKSGDEVGGKELFTLTDQGERELAIRPEMTPSVTRLVARRYQQWPKPIRLFNISNFARQERPQRGRNREFWQLNFDIFGEESLMADVEILTMAIEIMLAFGSPERSFVVRINSRVLLQEVLTDVVGISTDKQQEVTRLMDKSGKMSPETFAAAAEEVGLTSNQIAKLQEFLALEGMDQMMTFQNLSNYEGLRQVEFLISQFVKLGYPEWAVQFAPSLVRGFDYYDGMIFEVFDTNPENPRSLFGGGRYNGLASLFGVENFPAVGCAPGDETLALFLNSWGIAPDLSEQKTVYIPALSDDVVYYFGLGKALRQQGVTVVNGLSAVSIGNALSEANKKAYDWVLIVGEQERQSDEFSVKNLLTGEQTTVNSLEDVVKMIQ